VLQRVLCILRSSWRSLFRRNEIDHDLDDEVRSHLVLLADEKIAEGMKPEEALRAARIELGGIEQVKEKVREVRASAWLDTLWQDIRFGVRMLQKNPGFMAVAVLTLALGIGANTAIFSMVDSILLRPLPYPNANRLVWLAEFRKDWGSDEIAVPPPTFNDWQRDQHSFTSFSAVESDALTLTGSGEATKLHAGAVSASFFSVVGIHPALGRDFLPSDDRVDAPRVVILSYRLWRERFDADPNLIGRQVTLDDKPFMIVGVAPRGFDFPTSPEPDQVQVWTPAVPQIVADDPSAFTERGAHYLDVIGCLKPGVSLRSASADINSIEARIAQNTANDYSGFRAILVPLKQHIISDLGPALWMLLGAVGFILLIACANVANLLLSRGIGRHCEIAIRTAVGASAGRLVRQLLTESVLLSLFGGTLGILLAYSGLHWFLSFVPQGFPRVADVHVNAQVLASALSATFVVGIFCGVLPAWRALRVQPLAALASGGVLASPESPRRTSPITGRSLVIAEVAITMVLLCGAGLMLRSFFRLAKVDPGFCPRDVIAFQLGLDAVRYPRPAQQTAFFDQLLSRVSALPGVLSAGLGNNLPMLESMTSDTYVNGHWTRVFAQQESVGPDYFRTLCIPLLKGRALDTSDNLQSVPVAIVNETFVRELLAHENPIGQRIETHFAPLVSREIIGVVGDVHHSGLATSPPPEVFVPFAQVPNPDATLVVRTADGTRSVIPAVRTIVASLDKNQPIDRILTMPSLLEQSLSSPRFYSYLLGAFAGLALILAVVGTHGAIAYSVSRRTHEIGVRIALGAQRRDIMRIVVGQGMILELTGIGIGVGGALALTRLLRSLLFEIEPSDPATFIGVAVLLTLVALLACYVPARRAVRVDPMAALRHE
jgi:putative ABC transport system permease protein